MKIRKQTLKLTTAILLVTIVALLIAGTVLANKSLTGLSECHKENNDTELVCTGALASSICDGLPNQEWHLQFTGPKWSIIFVTDTNVGGQTWGDFPIGASCRTLDDSTFLPAVQPVHDEALMSVPASDGRLASGLFDLTGEGTTGHGYKTAYLTGWPNCPQDGNQLDMLCLSGEGTWVTPEFEDVTVSADGLEITWTSNQDGTCGFFAK